MAFKFSITLLLVVFVGSHVHRQTQATRKIINTHDDLELEEQLKILNKPANKSIKDETGALYDCVDINKQPAFDHPLLKDHKIQMEPTSFASELLVNESSPQRKKSSIVLQGIDCPKGTVPIRRISKDDLIRAQSIDIHPNLNQLFPDQYVAVLKSTIASGYKGARASMNIINPNITDDQSSHALIRIWDDLTAFTMIYDGWAVEPKLYGDHKPHLMIYWRDGITGPGCFNLLCKGFVQVDNRIPVGSVIPNVFIYDHNPVDFQLDVRQDPSTQNWWVTLKDYTGNPESNNWLKMGYLPGELLPNLRNGGVTVSFGGLNMGPEKGKSPPMAFGLDGHWIEYTNNPKCYGVKYYGLTPIHGHLMEYGGPGGC